MAIHSIHSHKSSVDHVVCRPIAVTAATRVVSEGSAVVWECVQLTRLTDTAGGLPTAVAWCRSGNVPREAAVTSRAGGDW